MERLLIEAIPRATRGKKVKVLRRQGVTPANIYGHGLESLPIQVDTHSLLRTLAQVGGSTLVQLKVDGEATPRPVLIREVQYSPRSGDMLHVDFYQVRMMERMQVEVSLVLVGEAPAVRDRGGVVLQNLSSLMVECLPADLPGQIEVDVSHLDSLEASLQVKNLSLPPAVTAVTDAEMLVVRVAPPRRAEVGEVVEEEGEAIVGEKVAPSTME